MERQCWARYGLVAWLGVARCGETGRGLAGYGIVARLGKAWKCAVWPGRVRRGVVWLSSMVGLGRVRPV